MTRMMWVIGLTVVLVAIASSAAQRERVVAGLDCGVRKFGNMTVWDASIPECRDAGSRR